VEPPNPQSSPAAPQPAYPTRPWVAAASDNGPTPGSIGWLWPEEAQPQGGGGGGPRWRPPGRWRYRAATLATLAAGALVGAGLFIGIALHSAPAAAHGNSSPTATVQPTTDPGTPSTAASLPPSSNGAVAADTGLAASWIEEQMAAGTVVACDTQTCAALTASGFPQVQEVQIGLNTQSLSNASVVVMTPTLQTFFSVVNPSLGAQVTPAVLASFGQVSIQVIWPGGAIAYQSALSQDVQYRIQLAEQLLNSGQLQASPLAESQLEAGEVDPRILLALQSLADQIPIDVLGFSDSGPGASPGIPFRVVDLAVSDPAAGMSEQPYVTTLASVLTRHATFPPYQKLEKVSYDGQTAVQVQYTAPNPLGLLSP
jgi:hypothetical protein